MHKYLILEAFKKARKERKRIGDNKPSLTSLSEDLEEATDFKIGGKNFRIYYNNARKMGNLSEDISISQLAIVHNLSKYLGYENYEDFVAKYNPAENTDGKKEKDDDKPPIIIITGSEESKIGNDKIQTEKGSQFNFWFRKNQKIIIINTIVLVSLIIMFSTDILSKSDERWMTWKNDRYVEIKFNITQYYSDELELYDQKKMEDFKKIENPDCNTKYFNDKGEPITWYYKIGKDNLEIYTAPGLHPINGKTLKPITRYIIKEHICKE